MENKDRREEFEKIFEKNEYFGISVRYGQKTAEGEYYQVESFIESILQSKQKEIEKVMDKMKKVHKFKVTEVEDIVKESYNQALDDLKPIISNILLK